MKPRIVKILYVEPGVDEKGGARMLEQSTENTNYSCVFTVVSNAFIGLECSEHTCYDFIIVKKDMQHLGAIDMLNVLKAVGCPTPLVVLLDEHDNCSDYDSNALGFFAALRKPLSTKILCTLIEAVVNRYTAASSSSSSSSHPSSSSSNLDISSNFCIESQAISLSDQRSSNDDNLNNEQLSTSVPVLENPRKGKGKSLKSKSLKATVSSAKSLNTINATFPVEKKSREKDDYADDMRAEKDEENIDYNKNIVIVKESHRGSSNLSMRPERGEESSAPYDTLNGDPLTNSKYPSEYFSLDEELLLMEGIRSSPFLTSKETPFNGHSGGRETPSSNGLGDQMLPQGLSSGNWDLRSVQTKHQQHQLQLSSSQYQSQQAAPLNIYDLYLYDKNNENNSIDAGFVIPNNKTNKGVLSNVDKRDERRRSEKHHDDKNTGFEAVNYSIQSRPLSPPSSAFHKLLNGVEMDIMGDQTDNGHSHESLSSGINQLGHQQVLSTSQSQYDPNLQLKMGPPPPPSEEGVVWDQNTAIQQLVNDWFPYRNTTSTPNFANTNRYLSLTTLSTASANQTESRGTASTNHNNYSNYSYNRNLNSNESTRGINLSSTRTDNNAFLLAGLNAKEMNPLNSLRNSPAPSPSMFSYSSLSSAYPPTSQTDTERESSRVGRPELSPSPLSNLANFNSSAFTSLPSKKVTSNIGSGSRRKSSIQIGQDVSQIDTGRDRNIVQKVQQKGAFGRKRAPIDQSSYDNFTEK